MQDEEIIQRCFQLMDRMAAELPKDEHFCASMLDTNLLNAVVRRWKNFIVSRSRLNSRRQPSKNHPGQDRGIPLPSTLAEKVDRYRWCSLVQPNTDTYNLILDGSVYQNNPKTGVLFADSLLEKMVQISSQSTLTEGLLSRTPFIFDVKTVALVCKAWTKSRLPQAPFKAQAWLDRLAELSEKEGRLDLRANSILYSTVIQAWADVGDAISAESVLEQQLQDFLENGNHDAKPDNTTFNTVLAAWSKTKNHQQEAPLRASAILDRMVNLNCMPDHYSLTSLLACYAKSNTPGAGEQAEAILHTCLKEAEGDEPISNISLPLSARLVAYNTVLDAYGREGNAQRAETLLRELLDDYTRGASDVRPDYVSFNSVLAAWSKVKDSPELVKEAPHRAEALLSEMQNLMDSSGDRGWETHPSGATYASILQCWSRSGCETSAENIERILKRMHDKYEQGQISSVKPNVVHYNIALKTLSAAASKPRNHRAIHQAQSLMEDMVQHDITPNEQTYRSFLHIVAGSTSRNKLAVAQELMDRMTRSGFRPNVQDRKIIERLSRRHTKLGSGKDIKAHGDRKQ